MAARELRERSLPRAAADEVEITTTRAAAAPHGHGIQHARQVRGGRDRPRVPLELVADAQRLGPAVPVRTTLAAAPS